jgi:hypothetical protein
MSGGKKLTDEEDRGSYLKLINLVYRGQGNSFILFDLKLFIERGNSNRVIKSI